MVQNDTVPKFLFVAGPDADTVTVAVEDGARAEDYLLRYGLFDDKAYESLRDGGVIVAGVREDDVTFRPRSSRSAGWVENEDSADCEGRV